TAVHALLAARPERVIVSAVQACAAQPKSLERVRVALSNRVVNATVQFLPGRNLFLKRTTFDAIGGFPEHLATCEDYWFTDKASLLGELYYSSEASYVHLGEDKTYWGMARKEMWRAQSNFYSLADRRITLKESASLIAPICVLIALVVLIPVTLLFGAMAFVFLLCAILLPVTLYSLRLLIGSGERLSISAVIAFYFLYFPARGIGMLAGLIDAINYGKIRGSAFRVRNQTR